MMRMRVLFGVLLLAMPAVAAESVVVQRYQAMFENGVHSALCVVPLSASKPGRARFVCHYAIPDQPRMRDDTDGGSKPPVLAPDTDTNFNVWLSQGFAPPAKCDLGPALRTAFPQLPTDAALLEKCPDAKIRTEPLNTANPANFIGEVRSAVAANLPAEIPKAVPAPQPPPQPSSAPTPVKTETVKTETVKTETAEAPAITTTSTDQLPPPPPPPPTDTAPKPAPEAKFEGPGLFDWTILGLLIVIAMGVVLLFADRLIQNERQKKVLDAARTSDDEVLKAANLEQAAVILHEQRNRARSQLEAAKIERDDATAALAEIDKHAGTASDEHRVGHIASLAKCEKSLLQLTGAPSSVSALEMVQTALKEHKEIDQLLAGRIQSGGAAQYVRDCIALVDAFSKSFWRKATDPVAAHRAVSEVTDQLHRLYTSFAQSGLMAEAAIDQIEALDLTFRDQKDRLEKLERSARAAASKVGCTAQNPDAIVTELVTMVERGRDASRDAQEILCLLRGYLALPDDSATELRALLEGELSQPNRVLRLVLAAAVPALHRLATTTGEDEAVVRMLRIPEIVDELDAFLARLSGYQENRLWDGIYSAFGNIWLHNLFRAEAVLRTYFGASRLGNLGDALTLAAWAFRDAIVTLGFDIDRVQLLDAPPAAMDSKYESSREFRAFPDIRSRVKTMLKVRGAGGFAIDVDSVGIRQGDKVVRPGAVVLANSADWED